MTPSGGVETELIAIMFRFIGHDCNGADWPTIVIDAPSGVHARSRMGRDSMRYVKRADGGAAASSTYPATRSNDATVSMARSKPRVPGSRK